MSLAGILAPFALGGGVGILLRSSGGFFSDSMCASQAALFLGASLSITAFPVMARIIHERGLTGTAIGTMALAAGAMDDVAAWLIFAIVVASFKGDASIAVIAFVGAAAYAAVVYGPLRPWLRRLARQADESGEVSPSTFGTILMLLMIGAWFTDRIGVHSVFGAFILGTAVPRGRLAQELQRSTARLRWACCCHSISCTRVSTPSSGWSTRRRCGWSRSGFSRWPASARAAPAGWRHGSTGPRSRRPSASACS